MGATTIFIDDDKPANLYLLTHLLRPLYQVRAASSGENAVRVAATVTQPDLVLRDVMRAIADQFNVWDNPER